MKRAIFDYMVERYGLYLPYYQLEKIESDFKSSKQGIFEFLYTLNEYGLEQYTDKNKGAYKVNNEHLDYTSKVSKVILQMDPKTSEVIAEHQSLYKAVKALKLKLGCTGSIANCARGNQNLAFGFKWEYKQ